MNIKHTFLSIRLAEMKKLTILNVREELERWLLTHCWWEYSQAQCFCKVVAHILCLFRRGIHTFLT